MTSQLIRLEKVAELYGIAPKTLYTQVTRGTARVMPCMVSPYRWRLKDVERDIETASYSDSRRQQRLEQKTKARDLQLAHGA